MQNNKSSIFAITTVTVILGVMIGMQLKAVKNQGQVLNVQRANELSAELKKVSDENELLKLRISELEGKNMEYENLIANSGQATEVLTNELSEIRIWAGFSDIKGQGIMVTLNDSPKKNPGSDQNLYLVHDEDILATINELYAAGAEAISINDQRLIATSSVRCVGPVVNVDGVKLAAPYVIKAIGDSAVLEGVLRIPGGVVDSLTPWGIEVSIKQVDEMFIDKYDQPLHFKFASPSVMAVFH